MKVLGIVGSMRKGRNTEILVRRVVSEMTSIDPLVTSDLIHVSDLDIHPAGSCVLMPTAPRICSSAPSQMTYRWY